MLCPTMINNIIQGVLSGESSFSKERFVIRIHFKDTSHSNNKRPENRLWDGLEMFLTH